MMRRELLRICLLVVVLVTTVTLKPQAGMQEMVLSTPVDLCISGGEAGPGKTWALLYESIRNVDNPDYRAVIFRRTYPQIMKPGGLWDTAFEVYPHFGGRPLKNTTSWEFPSGARIEFDHLDSLSYKSDWQGAQIALIGFDQLEYFTEDQFWFMFARNRSLCGVRPYVRATCNPIPDNDAVGGWLRRLVDWYIGEDGLAIEDRSGVIRWFARVGNDIVWAASEQAVRDEHGQELLPKSFTFIKGELEDNKILLDRDPGYRANLEALPLIDRMRLRGANWNVRASAGDYFQRDWFEVVRAAPALVDCIRYWDRAATPSRNGNSVKASWTAGVKMGKDARGVYYIVDVVRFQGSALDVEKRVKNVATQDTRNVRIGIEQDPGQAGKAEAQGHIRNLGGFDARTNTVRESKGTRAKPLSAQVEAGNVKLVEARWNDVFVKELENFDGTTACMADQVDATSGAFHLLTNFKRAGVW